MPASKGVTEKAPQSTVVQATSATQTNPQKPTGLTQWLIDHEREISLCFLIFSAALLILSATFGIADAKSDVLISKIDQGVLLGVKCVGLIGLITTLYLSIIKKSSEKKV